jgi:dUTP pyrophosphatase
MEKDKIEDYIKQLMRFEEEIKNIDDDESETDPNFVNELDSLLHGLSSDIQQSYGPQSLKLPVKIRLLKDNAMLPIYSKEGDAGMDLTITEIISNTTSDVTYGFGIALEIPVGYVGLIFPRSSIRKYELLLTNAVGVVDSGYRGEIQATFKKTNKLDSLKYQVGDRGAQIMILPYPQIEFVMSEDLSETDRGEGGFGSTGN